MARTAHPTLLRPFDAEDSGFAFGSHATEAMAALRRQVAEQRKPPYMLAPDSLFRKLWDTIAVLLILFLSISVPLSMGEFHKVLMREMGIARCGLSAERGCWRAAGVSAATPALQGSVRRTPATQSLTVATSCPLVHCPCFSAAFYAQTTCSGRVLQGLPEEAYEGVSLSTRGTFVVRRRPLISASGLAGSTPLSAILRHALPTLLCHAAAPLPHANEAPAMILCYLYTSLRLQISCVTAIFFAVDIALNFFTGGRQAWRLQLQTELEA